MPDAPRPTSRDLIYLDFGRLASIYSQLEGGLLDETKSSKEESSDQRNLRKYDLKLFKPEFGGISEERSSLVESRILHHDLLARTESALFEGNLAVDLNESLPTDSADPVLIRSALDGRAYVRAEGWATIEDYGKLLSFMDNFKELARFIGMCGVADDERASKLVNELETLRGKINQEQGAGKRRHLEAQAAKLQNQIDALIGAAVGLARVPDYLIRGLRLFVDSFLPDHISVRIYPFSNCPTFQLVAGLKRECFVDGDIENVLFSYGRAPNVKLSLFGLVTSAPEPDGHPFDFESEYAGTDEVDELALEKGMRSMFSALQGFERFVRFSRWPNLTLQPLALYRMIK